jgi:hypothetical protein
MIRAVGILQYFGFAFVVALFYPVFAFLYTPYTALLIKLTGGG